MAFVVMFAGELVWSPYGLVFDGCPCATNGPDERRGTKQQSSASLAIWYAAVSDHQKPLKTDKKIWVVVKVDVFSAAFTQSCSPFQRAQISSNQPVLDPSALSEGT